MKSLLLVIFTFITLGVLAGSEEHIQSTELTAPVRTQQGTVVNTEQGQVIDMKSPYDNTGVHNNTPNNGSMGAAKMISPMTQY